MVQKWYRNGTKMLILNFYNMMKRDQKMYKTNYSGSLIYEDFRGQKEGKQREGLGSPQWDFIISLL